VRVEHWLYKLPLRVRSLFHRAEVEQELNEELLFHFEQLVSQEAARGKTPREARLAAHHRLGNLTAVQEEARETWGWILLEQIGKDLQYAFRLLRRSPWFTATAVLTLALGIGANSAVFTLIESTLLRPIAVKHPERLRLLTWKENFGGWMAPNYGYLSPSFGSMYEQQVTDGGYMHIDFTPGLYKAFRGETDFFDSVFAFKELGRVTAVVDGNAEALNCFLVSGDFYRGLEVSPVIGRAIGPKDDVRTSEGSVALISYQYWTRRFNRSPSVIGKTISLNGLPMTIIGVNPQYFTGIEPGIGFEIWAPLNLPPIVYGRIRHGADAPTSTVVSFLDEDGFWSIPVMGRLKPDVSDRLVQTALNVIFQREVDTLAGPAAGRRAEPGKRPQFILQSASRGLDYLTERYDRLFVAVLALAALVLLIACANVANLLLAKAAVRGREITVRLAIGAGRSRIARQLLVEGLLLAAIAGIVGVVLGYSIRNGIPALLAAPWRPSPFGTAFDPRALTVCIGITFFAGVLFSLAPIWEARRMDMNDALKQGGRGTVGLSNLRVSRLLVIVQLALSIVLLVGAGFCVKAFTNLRDAPLGFQPKGVLLFSLDPPRLSYPDERMRLLPATLQHRLSAIPGVESATFSGRPGYFPIKLGNNDSAPNEYSLAVGSRFFETMGIRILSGRAIDEHGQTNGLHAVVVNQEFARRFFRAENPLGKTFTSSNDASYQIVGVCENWRTDRFGGPVNPAFYRALAEEPHPGGIDFQIKAATGDEALVISRIPDVVRSIDPGLVVVDAHTQLQQIENVLAPQRLMASLAEVFGTLALLLAAIGIYGIMAYAVARRTSEIGIRMALGAQPGGVTWIILRETLVMVMAGIGIGLPAVLAIAPLLDHFLGPYWSNGFACGLKPNDLFIVASAALILASAALVAGYLPAHRAATVDPMTALRQD
jgi:predicted permease